MLVAKTRQALERTGMKRLGVGGGVAANARFRERLAEMTATLGVELFIPPPALCTDNAAMAGIALPKLAAGQVAEPRRRRHRRTGPARTTARLRALTISASTRAAGGRMIAQARGSRRAIPVRSLLRVERRAAGRAPASCAARNRCEREAGG